MMRTPCVSRPKHKNNEPPRSKTARDQRVENEELKLIIGVALVLNVLTNHVPAAPFANRGDEETVGPEFPAPKFFLNVRVTTKDLSGGDTLDKAYEL